MFDVTLIFQYLTAAYQDTDSAFSMTSSTLHQAKLF